ncbi:VOC family protein [Streptomyces sp. NPDC054841]
MDLKLEVIVLPVSDVDRAKGFYEAAGFRLDIDNVASEDYRCVQFTPPGSEGSIIFGKGVTSAAPGSVQGLYLIVFDIEEARAELIGRGIEVSEVFHDAGGIFHHGHDAGEVIHPAGDEGRVAGPHPARADYGSYATFSDPDGNGWVLQEVRKRAPGR